MTPFYFVLDCVPSAEGPLRIVDVRGGVGRGLDSLAAAYGGQAAARARLRPYLERLGEAACGRRILFYHDPFAARQPFPDAFFDLVQRYAAYGPITDWIPDLQPRTGTGGAHAGAPPIEEMGVFLDPLAGRLKLRIAYCSVARIDYPEGKPMVLLSGYRERARRPGTTVVLAPEEIGAVVFSGVSERFPDDFRREAWFPVINPPLLDELLETKWLLPALLRDSAQAERLARWIPVGMGTRTADEVRAFAEAIRRPNGYPLAVLKPAHASLGPGVRFLDRTALRALAARQPARRLPADLAETLIAPRVSHSYEEVSSYRGKLLDNLLRTPGARVHDHRDGTFHFSAPYPFLRTTVAVLQEYVEARPIRSRRTGRWHRGSLRVVVFDRKIVAATYRLDPEPDDGTFRDLSRRDIPWLIEAAPPEDEATFQAELEPFVEEIERRFRERIASRVDLADLNRAWILAQTAGAGSEPA